MSIDWISLLPLLVGHLALFVFLLNLTHSANIPEKPLDLFNLAWLAVVVLSIPFLIGQGPWHTWSWLPKVYAMSCLGISLVGLPLVTIFRTFRKTPTGVDSRTNVLDLANERGMDQMIGAGRHHQMLRFPGNRSLRLARVDCDLRLPNLPRAFDGLTLVQLTDLHFSHCYAREFFEVVADEAARWNADLVVFTGDLLDDPSTIDWVVPIFSRLRGRLGQFAILGNHDHRLRPGRARRAMRRGGFTDLDGRWDRIEVDGASLAIGGTSAPWGLPIDYSAEAEADFRIVLSHSPDQFPRAARAGVELVLAGHNHGGQIRLPGFGPILMPSRYSRHFDRGFFRSRDGASTMYVSQGVGGKHPIRYGCTPEITRLTLKAMPVARLPHARDQVDVGLVREA